MALASEFSHLLRNALKRHVQETSSIPKAAKALGVADGTLRQFLQEKTDTGLRRAYEWAEQLGLPPEAWIRETALFPEHVTYSDLLREAFGNYQPIDPLVQASAKVAAGLNTELPETLRLLSAVVDIEDCLLLDPVAAEEMATKALKQKLRDLRKLHRERRRAEPDEVAEFYSLVGAYVLARHSKSTPLEWAWGLALALEYFQQSTDSIPLTWLLIDASMVLRRLFKVEESLKLARSASAAAVVQDATRLYPRALLALASILFYSGDYRAAAAIDGLVLSTPEPNPYQPLAAFSAAGALAEPDPEEAARLLAEHSSALEQLPHYRQTQRYWVEARVLACLEQDDAAFRAYDAAIRAGEHYGDAVTLFLIFDEARVLVGTHDARLPPIAGRLGKHLRRLSFQIPEAFLVADRYLKFFSARDELRMSSVHRQLTRLAEPAGSQPKEEQEEATPPSCPPCLL